MYSRPGPDWVIMGTPWHEPGKVALYASDRLTYAELEQEREDLELFDRIGPIRSMPMIITLHVRMRSYKIIIGDSYAECFQTLIRTWSPPEPERPEIEARRELTP